MLSRRNSLKFFFILDSSKDESLAVAKSSLSLPLSILSSFGDFAALGA